MWKISVLGCYLLIAIVAKNSNGTELPAGIEKCKYGDGQCLLEQINKVFEKYPHGNAELSVPDLNPLNLGSSDIIQDSTKSINLNMKMIEVENFHTIRFFNITPVQTEDWNNTVITQWASHPAMNIKSKYTITGKFLVLPIEGSGDMKLTIDNTRFAIKMKISTHKKEDGKTYAAVDKIKIISTAANLKIQMDNLFNGDKALGDNLNKVINENWSLLWDEMGPSINSIFAEKMKAIMTAFFETHPIEDIFII